MRAHAFFVALLLTASAGWAAENRNLDEASKRVEKQQWTEALDEL